MPIEILMPALSPTMEEGTLTKWLVKEGDEVNSGDVLAEIETDKATMEIEAVEEGVVAAILVAEGTAGVKVNAPIAVLLEDGEDKSAMDGYVAGGRKPCGCRAPLRPHLKKLVAPPPAKRVEEYQRIIPQHLFLHRKAGEVGRRRQAAARRGNPSLRYENQGQRIKASPLAKRLAKEKGLDLAAITGSGPNGRIVKADIENAGDANRCCACTCTCANRNNLRSRAFARRRG